MVVSSAWHYTAAMTIPVSVLLAISLSGSVVAAEKKIQRKDLPAAVQTAVQQEESNGATVKNIVAEKEGGRTVYEVEMTVRGHTRDLLFDAGGTVIETEEEVSLDAVPAPVKAALEARGTVVKVEVVTKGANVTYEGQIEKNGKKSEVAVDAAGRRIKG
jgi:uncharacterized membrane protein YkoI